MDAGVVRDALTLVAGVATGVMSGAFGVGGAVISTPAIRALGCTAALAVGTTLPSILPGAVTGSWRYRQGELIQWKVVAFTAPAGIVAAVLGAWDGVDTVLTSAIAARVFPGCSAAVTDANG
ncbi:MAG: hypothetical protein RLZ17_233, partial [Actinomycetota bacterium]